MKGVNSLKENKFLTGEELLENLPATSELETELKRLKYKSKYRRVLRSTISLLLVAAACAVLIVTLWMPVLQIYGKSMNPTLVNGEIVILRKTSNIKQGDIIGFYYNNKILIKRAVAFEGDWVNIDEDGTVYVNDKKLDEPYVKDKSLGDCDIEFPYQVPSGQIFVLGDNRSVSVDSRSNQIGCVSEEQIVGKIIFRVWPLKKAGTV
jgi:signal peptidase I